MALRAPSLRNIGRFCAGDFTRQLHDTRLRNAGNRRRPLWGLRDTVFALTENIGLIVTIGRRAFRQRFLVIAYAILVEERLVYEILVNHHPRQRRDQRGIGSGADRDPLIFASGTGVGIAWIDNNQSGVGFLPRLFQVVGHPAAAHPGFPRVIAKQHHQLAVFDIRRAIAIGPAAVGVVQSRGDLSGGVVTVMVEVTAAAVHQTGNQGFPRRP